MKINVFLLGTEHHLIVALSIIEERYSSDEFFNKFYFIGNKRLSQVNKSALPDHVKAWDLNFDTDENFTRRVKDEIWSTPVENLFVVNTYRPAETYILSRAQKSTTRHLIQDGALFYNRIERSVFLNHLKTVVFIYRDFWRKGIWFTDLLYYGRFMENSSYVDEIWMTHPEYYIGPKSKKPKHHVTLFPSEHSIKNFTRYFNLPSDVVASLNDCLLYLPVFIKDFSKIPLEIENIRQLLQRVKKNKVLIKVHPNASDTQYHALREAFGELVFRNNIAAEIYIANARDSYVVGCNSTSLFYHNPSCRYFALKKFYQDLGIFSPWHNINMPSHVQVVDRIEEIN